MNPEGNGQQYRVDMSGATRAHLKELYHEAILAGKRDLFLSAYRQIIGRLHRDPTVFGEPTYPLPALELQMRLAVIIPLAVEYGVHVHKPLVFARSFKLLS
jgi:hypothetical protein